MTLQDKATQINSGISASFGGDTPLIDITTNQADPLVNLVTAVLAGQIKLEDALTFLRSGLYPWDAEGDDLTLVAELMRSPRKIDQPSKVPVIVLGKSGAVLPSGSILLDNIGNEWETKSDAIVDNDGQGWTNACSPIGAFDLDNGELYLRDSFNGIKDATNSASPELGGTFEDDSALRRRLTSRRPHWQVKGTSGGLESDLVALQNVLIARVITDLPDCFHLICNDPEQTIKKYMVAVLGGTDQEIAEAIYKNLCFAADNFIGDSVYPVNCTDIHFQRMCPVIVDVRYYYNCDCRKPQANVEQVILDYLNERSLTQNTFGLSDLCMIDNDIIKVEFKAIPRLLMPDNCDCPIVFDNPITGVEDERYCTNDPKSHCYIEPDCVNEYDTCLTLQKWWYPVFLPEYITEGDGCPCPTPDDGCGCG